VIRDGTGVPIVPDDFGPWEAGDSSPYTPAQVEWLTRAGEAIALASEWWQQSTCSPFVGVCRTEYRRCVPCECRSRCVCGGLSWFEGLPVCGEILDATLRWWDWDGVEGATWTLGVELRVDNGRLTINADACGEWPPSIPDQNLAVPPGGCGTWALCVEHGVPIDTTTTADGRIVKGVPILVRAGVAAMACDVLKDCFPHPGCEPPSNATSVSNDGISIELEPVTIASLVEGRTGVDEWDRAVGLWQCRDVTVAMRDPASGFESPERQWVSRVSTLCEGG
jgi:hypothetical protein